MFACIVAPVRSGLLCLALLPALLTPIRLTRAGGCDQKSQSFAAQIERSEAVVFVERISDAMPKGAPGPTLYRVLDVLKGDRPGVTAGGELRLEFRTPGQPGDTGMLTGWTSKAWHWYGPYPLSRDGWQYVRNLPPTTLAEPERVAGFVRFLTHTDSAVVDDAIFELQRVPISRVASVIGEQTHGELSERVADDAVHPARRNDYARLLGLIGNDDDRALLRELALLPTTDLRVDAGGLMSGYLALAGEDGLRELEQQKLTPAEIVFSERYGAMQAIRFCHEHVPERIPTARLGQALQLILTDPSLCDLVFNDLRRMNDWSAVEKAPQIYETEALRTPANLRAMIRYLHVAADPELAGVTRPSPAQQAQATALLATLRDREPKRYAEAFRFFFRTDSTAP